MIGLALTKEQFQTLLRVVYIANTVVNGQREAGFLREYDELEQYIFSRAKDAGFPGAVLRHTAEGETHHHPSLLFDHDIEVNRLMDEYDAGVLLDLLPEKLAERDMDALYGPGRAEQLSEKDREFLKQELEQKYKDEFLAHGFSRLTLTHDDHGEHPT